MTFERAEAISICHSEGISTALLRFLRNDKLFNDGHIEIMFEFLPPLNGKVGQEDEEFWDSFEDTLEGELGVNIVREDRELFTIEEPKTDTAEKIRDYLEHYWS